MDTSTPTCTAFDGDHRVASGTYLEVALAVKALHQKRETFTLIFDNVSGKQIDFDLHGTDQEIAQRLAKTNEYTSPRRPGRPKIGVVAREVTLLPRHWDWLNAQPGGASVALRKLVEAARSEKAGVDRIRQAQAATDCFMNAMAGNLPHYEEAARALYARDKERFVELTDAWPLDLRVHARFLATEAFSNA